MGESKPLRIQRGCGNLPRSSRTGRIFLKPPSVLYEKKGLENVRLINTAERVGIALYRYFESREHITATTAGPRCVRWFLQLGRRREPRAGGGGGKASKSLRHLLTCQREKRMEPPFSSEKLPRVVIVGGGFGGLAVARALRNAQVRVPFHYFDKGNMAVVGRNFAVMEIGGFRRAGFLAWLVWGAVHLLFLAAPGNRIRVIIQWVWSYLTLQRDSRLTLGTGGKSKLFDGP